MKSADNSMIERANRIADAQHRLPEHSPIMAAVITATLVAVLLVTSEIFDDFLSRRWAEAVVILISALVAFLDCNQKWSLHSKAFRAAVDRLQRED
jgi:hypothetical protein